jgi:hypothetical protein
MTVVIAAVHESPFWHVRDMPSPSNDVRCSGYIESGPSGPSGLFLTLKGHSVIRCAPSKWVLNWLAVKC